MSIVTDALNRIQAERARPSGSVEPATKTEGNPSSPASNASKPNFFSPQTSSKTIRNILRWSLIIVGVVSVGVGAYLWGLTLMPEVARVSPDQEVIPKPVSPPPLEESAASPQVAKEADVTATEGQVSDANSESRDAASSETASPEISTQEAQPIESEEVASLPPKPMEVVKEAPREKKEIASTPKSLPKETQKKEAISSEVLQPPSIGETPLSEPSSEVTPSKSVKASGKPRIHTSTPTEAKLIQAKYLIQKRRYGHAMTLLKPLFVTPPETWEPWFWLGTAYLGLEQFEEAEEAFLEGLSRNAAIPHLWVQRALVSQQRGLYGEAVEALRQAEMIAPDLPEVQLNLAYSLEAQGQVGVAVQHYQNFLNMTEGQPPYQAARKKVLERIIRLEAA
ncbi:tetratricopeptide repeat protein [Candidatus Nitronereus thalassa]|uniref:Tetratricopeptide repeat protein n=1 Tax=Candidatus Nitronereus thalassa TaxID=3020898 RepID=A0ABU3K7D9_9BACT|nr:tetratricopeptide repeat protein [Candidatus Nitronereus thalassa]MDT7042355.1 hypothetical protein [Candidatus Nitronereus thalassa]